LAKHYVYGVGGLAGGGVANDGFLGVERRLRIGGIGTEGEEGQQAGCHGGAADAGAATVVGATLGEADIVALDKGSDM